MGVVGTAWRIFRKDLGIELRSREIVLSTALFAVLVVVIAAFALGIETAPGRAAAPGVLWIAISFSATLVLGRTFARERDNGVFTALLLTPAPRAGLYLGKVLGVTAFLLAVELILVPIIGLMFRAPLLASSHLLAPVALLGTLGYALPGTLFASMSLRTSLRDLLLGVILFPLVAPVLIFAAKATATAMDGGALADIVPYLRWLAVIDGIFLVLGLWLFGPVMED
ncbi:MAG TPA: heme exporter protein CcmB [Polyangia bacterium]|nr:heme exporter protein CcmB [Polyangia bacterium]